MLAECVAAIVLWSTGLGWNVFPGGAADLALTIVWVVGLVNAFNLIDNMDGAAATLAAVTSAAIGALALIEGDVALAILTFGLAGRLPRLPALQPDLAGAHLPRRRRQPADRLRGGGEHHGTADRRPDLGVEHVLVGVLLAGLPVLDTTLVSVSRRRAGVSLLTGGRDHLTHRLAVAPRQRANGGAHAGRSPGRPRRDRDRCRAARPRLRAGWPGSIWFVVATAAIVLLETSSWAPVREPARRDVRARSWRAGRAASRRRGRHPLVEAVVIAFIAISCGLSPFLYGFYDVSVWGPIALGMLAALLGLLIARPAAPRREALRRGRRAGRDSGCGRLPRPAGRSRRIRR